MPIEVARPNTLIWHAARSTGIGASEIAAVAGLHPYMTAFELYARKRGELPPVEETGPMRLGKRLEPVVKAEFRDATGIDFADYNPSMYRHSSRPELIATPDAIIDASRLFEAKTASWRVKGQWGDADSDRVPDQYFCQVQAQMNVMDADTVYLAVLFDGAELRRFEIHREDQLIDILSEAARELWQRIQAGDPPPFDFEHPTTANVIRQLRQSDSGTRIELTDEEAAAWARYEYLGRRAEEGKEERRAIRARIESLLVKGQHYAALLPDGRMIRRKWIVSEVAAHVKAYNDLRAVKADEGRIVDRNQKEAA